MDLLIVQVMQLFFLLMVIVVEPVQKCVAFIAENSSSHQGFVLVKEGIQTGGLSCAKTGSWDSFKYWSG